MVKFAKTGSIVTTAAVKLARAYTGRKLIAFPGDHPFYSYDDWFIGKTACDRGVPDEIKSLSVTFDSCNIDSLKNLFKKYKNQIAAVITEPEKSYCYSAPCKCGKKNPKEFLSKGIDLAHKNGSLFIFDEMVTGFKTHLPGSLTKYNLKPDLATWGKGIANGFSFCALTGTKEVMELGGIINKNQEKVFLISTTHGGETHGMAAAMATINEFKKHNVIKHMHNIGKLIIDNCNKVINKYGLEKHIEILDCDWQPAFIFKDNNKKLSMSFRTLALQEMIKNGVFHLYLTKKMM